MEIPSKRSSSCMKSIQNTEKRQKIKKLLKSPKMGQRSVSLRKELWMEILDYLDTWSFFCIIPKLNSFFHSLIKNCKNYRTSLTINLKYNPTKEFNGFCSEISKCKEIDFILNCRELKKLELNFQLLEIKKIYAFQTEKSLAHLLSPMIALNSLKVLKLNIKPHHIIEAKNILALFKNLEVLKYSFENDFTTDDLKMLSEYMKNYQLNSRMVLKKLSLKYGQNLRFNVSDLFTFLESIAGLQKISIQNTNSNNVLGILNFFKTNNSLKCIKLPCNYFFNGTSARELCNYLEFSKTLVQLQVSNSIMDYFDIFTNALLKNNSLRKLSLMQDTKNSTYDSYMKDFSKLLRHLACIFIEDLSIIFSFTKDSLVVTNSCNKDKLEMENFLQSLNYYLETSKTIRKIDINIIDLPFEYTNSLANLIIKHVELGNIEFFAGYNLKMLIDDKIEILELKKGSMVYENIFKIEILSETFLRLLAKTHRIIKIIEKNDYRNVTIIANFLNDLALSKCLTFNSKKMKNLPILHKISLIIFSTRIAGIITELDLKNMDEKIMLMFTFLNLLDSFKSLQKLKFTRCKLNGAKCLINKTLRNFISNSTLVSLNLSKIGLSSNLYNQLAQGLEGNQTITRLRLEKINVLYEKREINYNPEHEINMLINFLAILAKKTYYEKISVFYSEEFIDINGITDDNYELLLDRINYVLTSNQSLKEFNVIFKIPYKYLVTYSDILLDALRTNKELKIVNFIDKKKIISNARKAYNLAHDYFCIKDNYLDGGKCKIFSKNYADFRRFMPIIISEIIKETNPLVVEKLVKVLFGKNTNLKDKILNLVKFNNEPDFCSIYKFNFIEFFTSLEELTISTDYLTSEEIKTIEKKLQKLEFLHKINLKCSIINNINDFSGFLLAKNLTYLKITGFSLKNFIHTSFSKEMKSSNIEELILENIHNIDAFNNLKSCFQQLIESISCNSLKTLKMNTELSPNYLYLLFCNLSLFTNLEYIDFHLGKKFEIYQDTYQDTIKFLISIIISRSTKLNKFKVHKYIWDIEKLQTKSKLKFVRCQFNSADLWILALLCEENVFHNIKCIDLSDNRRVAKTNFIENITRVINALKCNEVIIKNCGCKQEDVYKVKYLLEVEINSLLNLV